jgi:hypothetical protein
MSSFRVFANELWEECNQVEKPLEGDFAGRCRVHSARNGAEQ